MKLNKTFGRIATTLVATAMLASLAAPVYADTEGTFDHEDPEEETVVYIDKAITKPGTSYLPDVDFYFDITPAKGVPAAGAELTTTVNGTDGQPDNKIESGKGTKLATTTPTQSEIDASQDVHTVTLAEQVKVTLNADAFKEVGEYQYTITEQSGTYEDDFEWAQQSLTLNVIVARDEKTQELYIYGYELSNPNKSNAKQDTFTNVYEVEENTSQTKDFDLTKVVAGNFATSNDKSAHYTFSVKVTNSTDKISKDYYAVVTHQSTCSGYDKSQVIDLTSDTASDVDIAPGDTFHIYGLTKNDTVTVTEKAESASGFDTTFTIDNTAESEEDADDLIATVSGFVGEDGNHAIECTNTKDAANPTGIVMDVAPYVLLVVVAAAGCFVFLRKRRED